MEVEQAGERNKNCLKSFFMKIYFCQKNNMKFFNIFLIFAYFLIFSILLLISPLKAEPPLFLDEYLPQLQAEVNSFRLEPLKWAQENQLSVEEVKSLWKDLFFILEQGLTPLSWDETLAWVARNHLEDLFSHLFVGHLSSEGLNPEERARRAGYRLLLLGESEAFILFENYLPPEKALELLLRRLFQDALLRKSPEGAPFLFPPYEELGAAFLGGQILLGDKTYNVYGLCLEFGLPANTPQPLLVGWVYDKSSLDKPLPENGLPNAELTLGSGSESIGQTFTFPDGSYFFLSPQFSDSSFFLVLKLAEHPVSVWRYFNACYPPCRRDFPLKKDWLPQSQ